MRYIHGWCSLWYCKGSNLHPLTAVRAESKAYIQDNSVEAPDFQQTIGAQNIAIKVSTDQLNGKMEKPENHVLSFNGNGKSSGIDHNDFTHVADEKINTDVWLLNNNTRMI